MQTTVQLDGLGAILVPQMSCSPASRSLFAAANTPAASVRKHRTRTGSPSEELTG